MNRFDEIIFQHRNKRYGAYILRKKYFHFILVASVISLLLATVVIFYGEYDIYTKTNIAYKIMHDTSGIIEFTNYDLLPMPQETPSNTASSSLELKPVKLLTTDVPLKEEQTQTEQLIGQMFKNSMDDLQENINKDLEKKLALQDSTDERSKDAPDIHNPIVNMEVIIKRYILEHTKYPDSALNNKIFGMVLVQFLLTNEGEIKQVSILQNAHPILDREALRVVNAIPKGKPVVLHGKPIKVMYKIPIVFKI